MAPPSTALTISVAETLGLLDGSFAETSEAFPDGRYALWLGSGISIDRMPPLRGVVKKVLDYLQRHTDPGDPNCRFRGSLDAVLQLAGLSPDEKSRVDYAVEIGLWPDIEVIAGRLIDRYAQMFDQAPIGEEADFLVWEAANVVAAYGDPAQTPDVEHLCIAALIMEGSVSDIASANWDGLVEKATRELSGGENLLRVVVLPEDTQSAPLQANLYKFHGCAVLAGADPVKYRKRLVGRSSQINGWHARAENAVMVGKLVDMATSKPTLMLGLSAQDSNIQGIFVAAEQRMQWAWPSHPPAYVFSENQLGADQVGLLQNVYRAAYTPANRAAILSSALLQAYGKPLLIAFWMHVLATKAKRLISSIAAANMNAADRSALSDGIKSLRNLAAACCPATDREAFVRLALSLVRRTMSFFRDGQEPSVGGASYQAISQLPPFRMAGDPTVGPSGLPELAVALGVVGTLIGSGDWTLSTVGGGGGTPGIFRVSAAAGNSADFFFAANAQSALVLSNQGHAPEDKDVIVVHSHEVTKPMPRSPRTRRGRTGHAGRREVSMRALIASATNADDLIQRFRKEAGL